MKMFRNNKAESPIEVMLVVMVTIIAMASLMLTMGTFVDQFMYTWGNVLASNPMGTWGNTMYTNLVTRYSTWVFLVPGFMILVILIWGIKTIIKKHQYSTQDTQFMADEF